ncbi:hypothetical protein [uncultured Kordia sp.]|uniref:hypothetical protein n=1 Tax=uncultured Kordia sp. TaxID=507699 RepID=UPI0026199A0B|nr:hypothetical protein [uncultured Kordia sp.]
MKKQILNIGKALSKAEQKAINGGALIPQPIGCPIVLLAAPPEGCRWVQNPLTCRYKLVCDAITAY